MLFYYQKSGGIKLGGEYSGYGGQLELDISKITLNNKKSSSYGTKVTSFTIGSTTKPYPISLTLRNISETLNPEYWTSLPEEGVSFDTLGIEQKKENLERALADYADYENVGEIKGKTINTVQQFYICSYMAYSSKVHLIITPK